MRSCVFPASPGCEFTDNDNAENRNGAIKDVEPVRRVAQGSHKSADKKGAEQSEVKQEPFEAKNLEQRCPDREERRQTPRAPQGVPRFREERKKGCSQGDTDVGDDARDVRRAHDGARCLANQCVLEAHGKGKGINHIRCSLRKNDDKDAEFQGEREGKSPCPCLNTFSAQAQRGGEGARHKERCGEKKSGCQMEMAFGVLHGRTGGLRSRGTTYGPGRGETRRR